MADDDRTLLAAFAATADQAAFAELVTRHGPLVWGVCRRAVKSEPLAEEAFQAVFVVLSRKAGSLALRTSLANWLFGVACRVAQRAVRREARLKRLEQSDTVRQAATSRAASARDRAGEVGGAEWQDMLRVLDEELSGISEKYRGPLVACYLQGKTQDEAAADLGVSIFKLRRRLGKAREVLRLRLTRRGVTMAGALFAGAVIAPVGFTATVPASTASATVKAGIAAKLGGGIAGPVAALGAAGGTAGAWAVGTLAVAVIAAILFFELTPQPKPEPKSPQLEVAPPPRSAPSETPGEWVTVRGRVVWLGELPEPRFSDVTADKPACCKDGPLRDTHLEVDAASRGVRNVVVWLRPDTTDRKDTFPADRIHPSLRSAPPAKHVIDQPKCQFEPRVTALRSGDSIVFKNSADIPHNVTMVTDKADHDLNTTIPSGGDHRETKPVAAQPTPILIKCDIHPWMAGRVRVFDHPYFAVTAADGSFELPKVPAGRWRIVYWHEGGFHAGRDGAIGFQVNVTGETTLPPVELKLPK